MAVINAHRLIDGQQLQDLLNSPGGTCPNDGFPLWQLDDLDTSMAYQIDSCPVDAVMTPFKAYIHQQVQIQTPVTGNIATAIERVEKIREAVLDLAIVWIHTTSNATPIIGDFIHNNFLPRLVYDDMVTQQVINLIDIPT